MNDKDLFKLIKNCLKTNSKIDLKSNTKILKNGTFRPTCNTNHFRQKFKNQTSKLSKLATAESVKDIHNILKAKVLK